MVKADAFGSFLVASTVGLFVVVYTFRIPHMITQNPSIVDEYYVGNFCWAFPVDIALIGAYLALSLSIAHIAGRTSCAQVVVATSLTTALLTGLFAAFFRSRPRDAGNIYSKWFHDVGYASALYDVILVVCVYLLHEFMMDTLKRA